MIARLRLFYLLYYGGVGTFLSFFAPYLRGLGFSGAQIGAATLGAQLLQGPAALCWGALADRLGAPARVLRACAAGSLCVLAFLPFARTPSQVGAVLALQAVFSGAIVPLVDALAMEWLRAHPAESYPRTRLFGSIGFVIAAQGMGLVLAARGDRAADPLVPLAYLACAAGVASASLGLPTIARAGSRKAQLSAPWELLRARPLALLLAVCAIHWASLAPYHLLFGVLVRDRGLSARVTGAALALGVLAEVGALFAFPALARRAGTRALLALSFAATALRWALLARADGAAALILLQLFHGLTFGVFWAAAVAALGRLVPPESRATGQALFSLLVFALGNAGGYASAGFLSDSLGGVPGVFTVAALVELAPLAAVLALGRGLDAPAAPGVPR